MELDDARRAEALDRYWDALAYGARPSPPPELGEAAVLVRRWTRPTEDTEAAQARVWRTIQREIGARDEAKGSLVHTTAVLDPSVFAPVLNGRGDPHHPYTPVHRRPRSMFWYAAAAMLMLAVVGGLAATRFGAPGSNGTRSGSIAAPLISPVATPGVSEVVFAWQTNGDPADPMKNATNLAIAPDGSIWVPDGQHGRFQIFSAEGELLDVWGRHGSGPGEFDFTTAGFEGYARGAIAFAPDGSFYVADTGNRRIQKFAADRSFLTSWGSEGLGDGQFVGISDLAVDSQGRVFVIDPSKAFDASGVPTGADTVQVFDADGTFLNSWGAPDNTTGALATPMGITIDWDGTVLAANLHSNRIERFTADGEHLGGWGDFGIREGQMFRPMDVAVDRQGNVYEVDYSNGRVQVFDQAGRFLMAWGQVGKGDGQFTGPVAVAIDDEGNVYITDDAGRLQKFHVVLTP